MQELIVTDNDNFIVENGMGHFPAYTKLKREAIELADNLKAITVTEDTITTNKKLVASTRKATDSLNRKLIDFKKRLLVPYEQVKVQVDDIIKVVKEAEDTVRSQTREFEEEERRLKNNEIELIFSKRIKQYKLIQKYELVYSRFFETRYLNKTMSINKVEEDLVQKMERIEKDLTIIDNHSERNKLFLNYIVKLDLTEALTKLQEEKDMLKKLEEQSKTTTKTFKIEVFTEANYELLKMYCEKMNIEFK